MDTLEDIETGGASTCEVSVPEVLVEAAEDPQKADKPDDRLMKATFPKPSFSFER